MASVVLLLAVGLQFALPSSATLPEITRQAPPAALSSVEPVHAAFNAYNAIMAHPIFAPDRAPPPAEADEAGNLSGVEVLGTAIAGKVSAALVRDADGEFSRIKVGEEIDGWKLVSIGPTDLTFDRNGERKSLQITATAPSRPGMNTKLGAGSAASSSSSSDDSDDSDDDDSDN
ncbi:MAG TPA: hypothetical protein VMF58_17610 [Rhizomicrobium sp.]|nr:hypothetical protein [Rhizomicrobium sp.]